MWRETRPATHQPGDLGRGFLPSQAWRCLEAQLVADPELHGTPQARGSQPSHAQILDPQTEMHPLRRGMAKTDPLIRLLPCQSTLLMLRTQLQYTQVTGICFAPHYINSTLMGGGDQHELAIITTC